MRVPEGRRLAWLVLPATLAYAVAAWWLLERFTPPSIGPVGGALLVLAVVAQFGGLWLFGELFRDGLPSGMVLIDPRAGFRAALVGAGVSRLVPVGGAITPLAMAWTVRHRAQHQARSVVGSAIRATTLNYSGLMIATGLALVWVDVRGLVPVARSGITLAGVLVAAVGGILMFGSARLGSLWRLLPRFLRERLEGAVIDQPPALRSQVVLWSRLLLEASAMVMVLRAFGIVATPTQMIAAFGAMQVLAGLPGTPGGLGFAEAGLIGALGVFGFPPEVTVAPTIVYRIVSYWLPAAAGLLAGGLTFFASPPADLESVGGDGGGAVAT